MHTDVGAPEPDGSKQDAPGPCFPLFSSGALIMQQQESPTRQFQMSTHCQVPSRCDRYGTRGTPMGIIRVTCRRGPPPVLQLHEHTISAAMLTDRNSI